MQWMKDCAGGDAAFVQRDRHTKIRFERALGALPLRERPRRPAAAGELRVPASGYVRGLAPPTSRRDRARRRDFASWIRWRFGDGIAEHFMDPYNEKVWKRDLAEITSDWVAGRVPDAPSTTCCARRSASAPRATRTRRSSTTRARRLPGDHRRHRADGPRPRAALDAGHRGRERRADGWRVDGEDFDLVGQHAAADRPAATSCASMPADVAARDARRSSTTRSSCSWSRSTAPEHPDLSWIYLPHPDAGPGEPHHVHVELRAASNAPAGKTSFLCEVTLAGRSPAPGRELEDEILDGLVHAGLIAARRGAVHRPQPRRARVRRLRPRLRRAPRGGAGLDERRASSRSGGSAASSTTTPTSA